MSQQTKSKSIKTLAGYDKKSPTDNLAYANSVLSGVFANPVDYPAPPIDEATFEGAIDTLSARARGHQDDASAVPLRRNGLQGRHADIPEERVSGGVHGQGDPYGAVQMDTHDHAGQDQWSASNGPCSRLRCDRLRTALGGDR
jgi:hypothetical protein